jgi:hypothetical protein
MKRSRRTTIAGQVDISMQLLEQSRPGVSGADFLIYKLLTEAYDAQVENVILNGEGRMVNGRAIEPVGFLHVPGHAEITATGSTALATYKAFGEGFAKVSKARKLHPTDYVLTGSRWAWLTTSEDISGRPLSPPIGLERPEVLNPVGNLLGIRASLSEPVGDNNVIVARPSDQLLFETQPKLATHTEVLSEGLEARLQLLGFMAFVPRRPESIAVIKGLPETGF